MSQPHTHETPTRSLVPAPAALRLTGGQTELPEQPRVAGPPEAVAAVRTALAVLDPVPAIDPAGQPTALTVVVDDTLGPEDYRLTVRDARVEVVAGSPRGAGWAGQTLRQLLPPARLLPGRSGPLRLPECEVEDRPRFGWRGAMLDCARHLASLPEVMGFVDLLALHKLNIFHWHLSDDQGWRFESERFPELTRRGAWRPETVTAAYGGDGTPHGGFYTREQMRAVVAHAAARGITVVPELDLPGHASAALAAYPAYAVDGEAPTEPATGFGIFDHVLDLSERSWELVTGLYEEVLDVFPGPWVHIGGDEAPSRRWADSPAAAARAADLGLSGPERLQGWFTRRLAGWLLERGRVPVAWDDACDDGPVPGLVCQAWQDPARGGAAAAAGMDVVMSPLQHTYLDFYADAGPDEPYAIGGLTTWRTALGFDPLAGVPEEAAGRVLGTSFQLWREYLPTWPRVEYAAWPRGCALADVAWSREVPDADTYAARLAGHLRRLDALGVAYRPLEGPRPWQRGGTGRHRRPEA